MENILKITSFAILLGLLLAPSYARADVFVFPLPDEEAPSNAQPYYQQQNRAQLAPHAQPPAPRPLAYASPCALPMTAREDRIVYFGFGQSRLGNEAEAKLNSLAIRPISTDSVTSVRIVGYADRIGSDSANEKLSRKRADNVRKYLIDRELIEPYGIETRWVGKSQASNHCSKHLPRAKLLRCLQPDRRVEVNINYRPQTSQQR